MTRGVSRFLGLLGLSVALALTLVAASPGGGGGSAVPGTSSAKGQGERDCNGWSPEYKSVKQAMMALCTDPITMKNGKGSRFTDNGWYVGHDEPSLKFISSAKGSGNHMTYYAQLPVDPKAAPTLDGSVTDYAELSPAPWFGIPICDPKSFPQNPCKPDSDSNTGLGAPTDAGSAFEEMQLYPPGYQPFIDGPSCDATRWCAALTIDSLECDASGSCNNNCIEPQNFAYIQRDGVPAGPPGPPDVNTQSLTANDKTLMMNQGDSIKITLKDTDDGFKVVIRDFTTGQSGFMVASAANGFENTNISDCSVQKFSFHPEYSTAKKQNQVPWAALEGGVLMEQEIGHFETCAGVSNALVDSTGAALLPFDPYTFQTCNGSSEGNTVGEGPCDFNTGDCQNSTTSGGAACPAPNFTGNALCEFEDAICVPAGFRPVDPTVMFDGATTSTWPIAGCEDNFVENGDLDFDGTSYQAVWPDGTSNHPTTFAYAGPFDAKGDPYPQIQFETNSAGSDSACDTTSGSGCQAKPHGANFYPFWSIGKVSAPTGFPSSETSSPDAMTDSTTSAAPSGHKSGHGLCVWNFGNDIAGVTTDDFGKDAEYGAPNVARYAGTLTSPVMSNPQLNSSCKASKR